MFQAYVLVRNLASRAKRLDFGEFTINFVGLRYQELREVFASVDVNQDDWIFEKSYQQLPPGPPGSPVGGIPTDVEDILLALRLSRPGDLSFIKQTIIPPSGNKQVQFPYRAINDLNSYSPLLFEITAEECEAAKTFIDGIRQSQSWRADWFAAARRFFVGGGARPFNPQWDDVDRIVDYTTALEATLVPEKDFIGRRVRLRAAALVAPGSQEEKEAIIKLMKRLYDVRSCIVHGSRLGDDNREWLIENCAQIELRVRQVLVAAVQQLPPGDNERCAALAALFEPTDEDRGNFAFEKFQAIKTKAVRKEIAAKIRAVVGD
jgi:hypothetical protein